MKTIHSSRLSGRPAVLAAALVVVAAAGCKTTPAAADSPAAAGGCRHSHVVAASATPQQPIQADAVAGFCGPAFDAAACGPCRWSMAVASRCGGAESSPAQDLICVCNQCLQDADCTAKAGGRCVAVRDQASTVQLCVYAGESCHPEAPCASGQECALDQLGARSCQPAEPCGPK
jgi:hypothetical protein